MLLRFVAVAAMTSWTSLHTRFGAACRCNFPWKAKLAARRGEAKFEATEPGPDRGKDQNTELKTIRSNNLRFNIFCFGFPEATVPCFFWKKWFSKWRPNGAKRRHFSALGLASGEAAAAWTSGSHRSAAKLHLGGRSCSVKVHPLRLVCPLPLASILFHLFRYKLYLLPFGSILFC